MLRLLIALTLILGITPSALGAFLIGTVLEVRKDGFTMKTEEGRTVSLKVSDILLSGAIDPNQPGYPSKFAELRKGSELYVRYWTPYPDKTRLVCEGLAVRKQPPPAKRPESKKK